MKAFSFGTWIVVWLLIVPPLVYAFVFWLVPAFYWLLVQYFRLLKKLIGLPFDKWVAKQVLTDGWMKNAPKATFRGKLFSQIVEQYHD